MGNSMSLLLYKGKEQGCWMDAMLLLLQQHGLCKGLQLALTHSTPCCVCVCEGQRLLVKTNERL